MGGVALAGLVVLPWLVFARPLEEERPKRPRAVDTAVVTTEITVGDSKVVHLRSQIQLLREALTEADAQRRQRLRREIRQARQEIRELRRR
jgi:hypothetical protein